MIRRVEPRDIRFLRDMLHHAFYRREAPAGDHWMDEHQWNKIAAGLEVLAHEANRMAPDADAFKRQATLVADALTVS